jgi:serine phosphatase RsbU (regulator of sigma subunit)
VLGFFRRHVSAQLATIWLVVAIPLSVLLVATYGEWYAARSTVVAQERQGYATAAAASFDLLLTQMRLSARSFGTDLADAGRSPDAVSATLKRMSTPFPVAYAAFADLSGRVVAATDPHLVGQSVTTATAFQQALQAPDGGGLDRSHVASGGVVGFTVAQRIPESASRPAGVVLMLVDVRKLAQSFPMNVPARGISIVDSAGQVVYDSDNGGFAQARAPWGAEFAFVRDALNGKVALTRAFRVHGQGERIGAFVPIKSIGWAAGSSIPPDTALAPFYRARVVGFPATVLTVVLALFVSIAIARGIARSLDSLATESDRIGSGGLDEPVRVTREDEIGRVERSLDAARLELLSRREQTQQDLEAERERVRLGRSMAEISVDLASSLDVDETLPDVLKRAAADLRAYGALVADQSEGGWTVRHLFGIRSDVIQAGSFFTAETVPTMRHLVQTHEPYIVPDALAEPLANVDLVRREDFRAYAAYPLLVRGQLTGAVVVMFDEPREPSDQELDYLRRIAFSVSLAEENSRLYKAEHRIAETLQTALLALPERVPGVEFACSYHSATEAARVGGDFYDLFELEHRMVGMTVGDISGHGVDAAVLTSLVKNAIRVQATQQDRNPALVMASAARLLFDNSPPEIFATVFFGVLHLDEGRLEYCNAGHTTGARICRDGGAARLRSNSPLIGAFPIEEFEVSSEPIAVDDLIFLYTDGLTEARHDSELFGEERLFELLEHEPSGEPERTVRGVLERTLAFAGGRLSDDLAVLAVRRSGEGGR